MSNFLRIFFPSCTWHFPTKEKVLYLTFDDGPIPEITPWVLKTLEIFQAKATFFCIGDNVRKHPEIYQQVIAAGHTIGNHTYNHLNGWKTKNKDYFENISACEKMVASKLFRPPYGKLKPSQISRLKKEYRIILWDVLSRDYDESKNGPYCFNQVIRHSRPGSIIVFHDSLKAEMRLKYALPKVLEHFEKLGYRFEQISPPG